MVEIRFSDENGGGLGEGVFSTARYRPFLGISVSNRPLPLQTAVKILNWSLQSRCPVFPILIADEIAHINYKALSHYTFGGALKRARCDGERHIALWREALRYLPPGQAERIRFVRWPEMMTPIYQQQIAIVRDEFERNEDFRRIVIEFAEGFISRSGKQLTPKRGLAVSEYIIQEIPALVFGIKVDGVQYQMLLYPSTSSTEMSRLAVAIQKQQRFGEFRDRLKIEPLEHNTLVDILLDEEEYQCSQSSQVSVGSWLNEVSG
jgi:tRNA-dependent cyclodipeptide synthase